MREKIVFREDDRIAVIAPHPDDECLGAGAVLLLAPERTDIFVLTDGSHGNPEKSIEEEAVIRRMQFEAEMEAVRSTSPPTQRFFCPGMKAPIRITGPRR